MKKITQIRLITKTAKSYKLERQNFSDENYFRKKPVHVWRKQRYKNIVNKLKYEDSTSIISFGAYAL